MTVRVGVMGSYASLIPSTAAPAPPAPFQEGAVGLAPARDGIDIAEYQHHVKAEVVVASGVQWWAHKCSIGISTDPFHAVNVGKAESVPLRARHVYHWLRPTVPVVGQVNYFLSQMPSVWDGTWRPMLDAEQTGITAAMTQEWCERVEQKTQTWTAVYSGIYVAAGTIWKSKAIYNGERPRILAAYVSEARMRQLVATDGGGFLPDVWQFLGDNGRCPGVGAMTTTGQWVELTCDNDTVLDWTKFDATCGEEHA